MAKVLIISYYWPPSGGAGVQRWLKFVKYLVHFGWEPHVYTPSNPEAPALDYSLEKDIPKEAVIIQKSIFEPYSFYKSFTGKKGNINAGFLSEDENSRMKFTEKMSIWIRGNWFIPDARVFWVRPSIRFLKKYIKEQGIETIISTGPPHSMHLIAKGLKRKVKVKWIADFRDPWTNIDFYKDLMLTKTSDQKHHRLEREVLQEADELIAIGKTMAVELEQVAGKKVHVITNGYDDTDYTFDDKRDKGIFEILHIGSINPDRNHDIFWQGLSELCEENLAFSSKLKIKFIGKLDYAVHAAMQKYSLEKKCEIIPYLPHDEVLQYFSQAAVLYLPFNNTPNSKGVLTGKFFEYLAAQKPIAAIGNIQGDAYEILQTTKSGKMVDFDDLSGFKKMMLDLFSSDSFKPNNEEIDKYSRKNLTKALIQVLENHKA
jgi:glycosyltransferase involved in cell wall biosynthesis